MSQIRLLLVGLFLALLNTVGIAADKLDAIAAVVGDSVILTSELDAYCFMRLNGSGQKVDSSMVSSSRKQFLNELIDGKILIVHAAKDTNIIVKEAEVDQAVNNQVQMILQQNGITMAVLEQELKSKYGMGISKFKSQMRSQMQEQLVRQKVQQLYVASTVQISRKDVEAFYAHFKDSLPRLGESVLLSKLEIKLSASDSMRQLAFAKITGIKRRLDNGEDFSALAKQYSDDPSAENGGDLGFIKKGTLSELAFEQRAFSLATGQISDVFESRLGFHIISVVAKKDQMVQVRQIFVQVTPPQESIRKITLLLDSIRTRCASLTDFVLAVKQFSTDNQLKASEGKMGWQSLYELPEAVKSAVDSLKAGDISKPVREGNTFAVYRVNDRIAQRSLTLEDDYPALTEKTREITAQKRLLDLVKKWRKEVFVEIRI